MTRRLILALAAVVLASGTATASRIAPYYTADGTVCDGTPQAFTLFTIYVFAQLYGDAAANGITGAEFFVSGFDPSWFTTVTANPAATVVIGNPIAIGCNIVFPACQVPANHQVLLYTIQVLALSPIGSRTFEIRPHSVPSNSNYPCVLVTLCDAPVFSKLCLAPVSACANRDQTCCVLAVEATTWGQVKTLYAGGR